MTTTAGTPTTAPDSLESWWDSGFTWDAYLDEEVEEHRDLWQGVYRRATTPVWTLEALEDMERKWKLLAIAEDWCGDASNLVPVFGRLARDSEWVDLRVVKRDENPDLMDMYLTNGSRSIPIVVIMDEDCLPVGRWGPRPVELQEFVIREKRAGERSSPEIYRETRRWYARDRGRTTLREMLAIMADVD
jgi:hypothetical protein